MFDIVQYLTPQAGAFLWIMFPCYCVSLPWQEDTAKITAALHGCGSSMDDIPLFTGSPAGVQESQAATAAGWQPAQTYLH